MLDLGGGKGAMSFWQRRHNWVLALGAGLCSLVPACQLPGPGMRGTRAASATEGHPPARGSADVAAMPMSAPPERPAPPPGVKVASSEYGGLPDPAPPPGSNTVVPAHGAGSAEGKIAPVGVNVRAAEARSQNKNLHPDLIPNDPRNTGAQAVGPVASPRQIASLGSEDQENTAVKKPPTREAGLLNALRAYVEKRPPDALVALKQYDPFSQEMLIRLLPVVVDLTETEMSERQRALMLEQIDSAMASLRARAPLVIAKMCLCKSIDTFGVYDRVPDDHVFQAGDEVLIYAEVQNFTSERVEAVAGRPVFVTRLDSSVTIRNSDSNKAVWKQEFHRDSPDQSQTLRHDYFDHYRFCLPKLRPGWYKVEIQVEDVATHRKARRSLDLKVGVTPPGT
jgi:hypothetical protein